MLKNKSNRMHAIDLSTFKSTTILLFAVRPLTVRTFHIAFEMIGEEEEKNHTHTHQRNDISNVIKLNLFVLTIRHRRWTYMLL